MFCLRLSENFPVNFYFFENGNSINDKFLIEKNKTSS